MVYKMLANRVYVGEAVHRGQAYPGEHEAIVDRDLWDRAHAILSESPRSRASATRRQTPALLKGLIFSPTGLAMTPMQTRRRGKLYRYYVTTSVIKLGPDTCPVGRVSAGQIESLVIDQLRAILLTPELVVKAFLAAKATDCTVTESEVRDALVTLDPLWGELFPAEQARIFRLLVDRVDLTEDSASIRLRTGGLDSLVCELKGIR
jgi:hypothetical protein